MDNQLRLVIAEDSEDDALLVIEELKRGGFSPAYTRVDTEEALLNALSKRPDAAIVDYSMPELGGIEAIKLIGNSGLDIPIIVVSGFVGEETAVAAMKAGAHDFVSKRNLSRLFPAVKRELRESEVRRLNKRAIEEIRLLNRLLETTYEINQMIVREKESSRMLSEACRILVELGGFPAVWIGIADRGLNKVLKAASAGDNRCVDEDCLRCEANPEGCGIAGRAVMTGAHVICRDLTEADIPYGRKANAERMGYSVCASFPFKIRDEVAGCINVFSGDSAVFVEKMINLLNELAGDIGYALQALSEANERRRAEQGLRNSEERLRTIFESSMDGLFVIDTEGRYIDVNASGCRMFGYTKEEFLSSDVRFLFFPGSDAKYEKHRNEYWEKGAVLPEVRLKKKDGSEIWVDMTITPFNLGGRRLVLGVKRDITARRAAEEGFRESEERFRNIFEQSEDAHLIIECGSLKIMDANPAAVALYGFTREELAGEGVSLFIPPEEYGRFADIMMCGASGTRIERMENVTKGGKPIITSIRGQMIRLMEANVIYCTIRDLTAIIRMEEEARSTHEKLIHANKMTSIGTLAAGVAHEINNPNNFILFNSTLLFDAWNDSVGILNQYYDENGDFSLGGLPYSEMREVIPELLSGITDGSRRIKGIVDSLKDFSRGERAGGEGEFDVNRAVMASIAILTNQINKYTDDFSVSCAGDLPKVKGSEQRIEQVLINLILNALHALRDRKSAVSVETFFDPGERSVVIKVKDGGIGMSRDLLERITEPFFTTKTDTGGTGLGLSISYSIIKEHNGVLEFASEPGRGTVVTLKLPAVQPEDGNRKKEGNC